MLYKRHVNNTHCFSVTIDGIAFSIKNRIGGITVYLENLINLLKNQKIYLKILNVQRKQSNNFILDLPQHIVSCRNHRLFERYRPVNKINTKIFHSSYYRWSNDKNVKNIITVYDFIYENNSYGIAKIIHLLQKNIAVKKSHAVICISNYTKKLFIKKYPRYPRQNIYVTHLAANPLIYQKTMTLNNKSPHRPFVLFVGNRSGYKNFNFAIESLALLQNIDLVCVGGGPFTKNEQSLLIKKLPNRYYHKVHCSTHKLNNLYNEAVCLLYPSLNEGFGIPVVEAMQAGCPFIAMKRTSIPEVAGKAGILLCNLNPKNCALSIKKCMHPEKRLQLQQLGITQSKKFSWEMTVASTIQIYKNVVGLN